VFTRPLLLLLLLSAAARADLQWASDKVFVAADPSQGRATAQFIFTNTGSYPISVTSTRTSCGCTAAVADERPVAPGKTGIIDVSFKTLSRHGLYEEPILIYTDDPKNQVCTIILRILVQEPVEVLPTLLFWQPGEPLTPKVALITVTDGFTLQGITAASSDPGVQARIDPVKPGVNYKLTVTPLAPHARAKIAITPQILGKSPRVITVHVRVS
jgi:hypothetical protein